MKPIVFNSHPIVRAARAEHLIRNSRILLPRQMEAMGQFLLEKQRLAQRHKALTEVDEVSSQ